MKRTFLPLLVAPLLGLAACGASAHVGISVDKTVSADKVAAKVKSQFTDPAQRAAAKVSCGDLAVKVGATDDCTVDMGDSSFGARLTVDKADGDDIHYTVRPFMTGEQLTTFVAQKLGASPDALSCPEIDGVKGTKVSCTVSKGTAKSVEVTVTKVEGGLLMDLNMKAQG